MRKCDPHELHDLLRREFEDSTSELIFVETVRDGDDTLVLLKELMTFGLIIVLHAEVSEESEGVPCCALT